MKGLYDFTYDQMGDMALEQGWKKFRVHQILQWLYRKHVVSIDDMSGLPKDTKETLKQQLSLAPLEPRDKQVASDRTTKHLFALEDGSLTESVLMQLDYGKGICVTSQVGYNIAYAFCASGLTKKKRSLINGEMVAQVLYAQRDLDKQEDRLSHIAVMGAGEPFDNYEHVMGFLSAINHNRELGIGARHITISTCDVVPKIYEFAKECAQYNLVISLHALNSELRDRLIPVNRAYPLEELMETIRYYVRENNRHLMFEYILPRGVNGQKRHVAQLVKPLKGLDTYVSLTLYSTVDESGSQGMDHAHAMVFYDALTKQRVHCIIHREHGTDIDATCRQLRIRHLKKEQEGSCS